MEMSDDAYKSLQNFDGWTKFLTTAAWQYKYPFQDQVMIFSQRPDARACASLEVWNSSLHRWINKGAKGIALLRRGNDNQYIDYVFDISDTNSFYGNEVRLWQYNDRYKEAIIETLENTFGELSDKVSVIDAVISAAHNAVEDNKADYLSELKYSKYGSFLEELDELNIDVEFQKTAENSISFMILERMGYDAFDFFDNEDFPHIMDFNTVETQNILGNAISSISEQALREVAQTIRAENQKIQNASKFFAENQSPEYNISTDGNKTIIENERNDENGRIDLQTRGRLSDTEHRTSGEQADRQIRNDEGNILEEREELPLHNDVNERNAERASLGNRPNGETASRTDSTADGEIGGHQRGTESERPNEMGTAYEQPSPFGRRKRNTGANLQLSLFPLLEEQQDMIREAERNTFGSAFSISQQIIDEVITNGSNKENSIVNICVEFSKNKSLDDKIAFLQAEFKDGGKGFIFDGNNISAWWNNDGMYISQGKTAETVDKYLTWEQVAKRIDELLDLGRFAPQEVLDSMESFEYKRAARFLKETVRNIDFDEYGNC